MYCPYIRTMSGKLNKRAERGERKTYKKRNREKGNKGKEIGTNVKSFESQVESETIIKQTSSILVLYLKANKNLRMITCF